jgi:chemotaxis protein CheD
VLWQILVQMQPSGLDDLNELYQSVINEVSNIMLGNYLQAISQMTGFTLHMEPPAFAADMAMAVLSSILVEALYGQRELLAIETAFKTPEHEFKGYFLYLPETGNLEKLFGVLGHLGAKSMGKAEVKLAGMGEIVFARGAGVLGCIGLGSCVGTVLFDPRTQAAALAHVMLPEAQGSDAAIQPGKYATTALPALLRMLDTPPAFAARLKAILIGGGELFQNRSQALRIGERNVETLQRLLREAAHRGGVRAYSGQFRTLIRVRCGDRADFACVQWEAIVWKKTYRRSWAFCAEPPDGG